MSDFESDEVDDACDARDVDNFVEPRPVLPEASASPVDVSASGANDVNATIPTKMNFLLSRSSQIVWNWQVDGE